MQSFAILYPAFAMVFLTFIASIWLLATRLRAVKEGMSPKFFYLNGGYDAPSYTLQAAQHYENLFEMPVLFYVLLILLYVTQSSTMGLVVLAWGYVARRAVHTYVHLGSNKLKRRRDMFLISFLILLLMWLWTLARLIMH